MKEMCYYGGFSLGSACTILYKAWPSCMVIHESCTLAREVLLVMCVTLPARLDPCKFKLRGATNKIIWRHHKWGQAKADPGAWNVGEKAGKVGPSAKVGPLCHSIPGTIQAKQR